MYRINKKPKTKGVPSPLRFEIADHDDNIKYLIGWPGYRTSNDKSGLGYVETRAEWAHMQGIMIRRMVEGKFRTRNPIYLLGMGIVGSIYGFPVFFIIHELVVWGDWTMLFLLVTSLPSIGIGVLLLINLVLSIADWNGQSITRD